MNLRLPLLAFTLTAAATALHAQTVSQDYARYASMLNQERADSLSRDRQSMADQSRNSNRPSGSSSSGFSYSGGGGSSSGASQSIGMLSGTLGNIMDRHNASAAARQQRNNNARAAYEQRERDRIQASDDFIAAYEKAHPVIQQNLEKAAAGDVHALMSAGVQYMYGIGTTKDVPKGISLLTDAGNRGDADAMRLLGAAYDGVGKIVPADRVKTYYWQSKLAATGNVDAMSNICAYDLTANGTPLKVEEGERICLQAMEKGSPEAANSLGYIYAGGISTVKPDRVKAAAYYRKAIALGSDSAEKALLYMYNGGDGQPADYATLLQLYTPMVDKGDTTAEIEVALLYYFGRGVPKDQVKAAALFRKAADQGSARAMHELASMMEDGEGIPKDTAGALKLYRQSAVMGWAPSLYTMGIRTMNGDDVQQDQIEGERILHLAADNGDVHAPYVLYQIYANGYGVDVDTDAAQRWLKLGAERGDKLALEKLKTT